jgi:hypothetical protein
MTRTITLNDDEMALLVDLLESERNELPTEIHHTDTPDYKARLVKRFDVVKKLLATLHNVPNDRDVLSE